MTKHVFFSLCAHFGKYRDGWENLHYHPCHHEDCDRVLVGEGWFCDGKAASHHRETLCA